jgi:PadR family transcriptional regulator, regulatory protein PadR
VAPVDSQLLKGILSMVLLALLVSEDDYGYSVVVRLREAGFHDMNEGTVYPALTRLETKGWLVSRLVASNSGPARKYYRTTDAGRVELARADESWHDLGRIVDGLLINRSTAPTSKTPKGDRRVPR